MNKKFLSWKYFAGFLDVRWLIMIAKIAANLELSTNCRQTANPEHLIGSNLSKIVWTTIKTDVLIVSIECDPQRLRPE